MKLFNSSNKINTNSINIIITKNVKGYSKDSPIFTSLNNLNAENPKNTSRITNSTILIKPIYICSSLK